MSTFKPEYQVNDFPQYQCGVRVQVVKSESDSSPQSPSPSLSHHLRVRVPKKNWVRVTNLVVHIIQHFVYLSKHNKQNIFLFLICFNKWPTTTTKCIECQSTHINMARLILLGLGHDSGPSHDFWVRVRVKWKKKHCGKTFDHSYLTSIVTFVFIQERNHTLVNIVGNHLDDPQIWKAIYVYSHRRETIFMWTLWEIFRANFNLEWTYAYSYRRETIFM